MVSKNFSIEQIIHFIQTNGHRHPHTVFHIYSCILRHCKPSLFNGTKLFNGSIGFLSLLSPCSSVLVTRLYMYNVQYSEGLSMCNPKNCTSCEKFVFWFAILQWRKFKISLPTATTSNSNNSNQQQSTM